VTALAVELATADDLEAIVAIANWAALHTTANFATVAEPVSQWRSWWQETHAMYPWLVARRDGRVVGFAKASPHRARGAYAWMAEVTVYVHPEAHRQGVGRALYGRLIPILRAQGYTTLLAGITSPHPASEQLHQSFGFVRCGTFHRAGWKQGQWLDVGYWELLLETADKPPDVIRAVAEVSSEIGA
jgi:L-amino acid N-acyltransferase YncA